MELTDFEALSFDCSGTLIDWEAGLTAVLVPWARERGLSHGGEELLTGYAAAEAAAEAGHPAERYPGLSPHECESPRASGPWPRASGP